MAQSLSGVYVHITFSTKHRHPFIDDDIETRLFEYIGGICKNLECNPIVIGGHKDHIHILCLLSRKISQSKLLEEIKKNSSKWIKSVDTKYKNFYWQDGFGIFSVNPSEIDIVRDYINNQKERHKKISFQEEYLAFLKKYKIEYDERYLWTEMNLAFALSGLLIDLDNLRRALPHADASSPSGLIRGTFKIIRKEI